MERSKMRDKTQQEINKELQERIEKLEDIVDDLQGYIAKLDNRTSGLIRFGNAISTQVKREL